MANFEVVGNTLLASGNEVARKDGRSASLRNGIADGKILQKTGSRILDRSSERECSECNSGSEGDGAE